MSWATPPRQFRTRPSHADLAPLLLSTRRPKPKKAWGVKPTDEQIAARQAKKVAAREAAGLPPPIHPTPKTVWADQLVASNDAADTAKVDAPVKAASKKRSRPAKAPKA